MPNNRLTRLSLLFLPFLLSIHRPVARITVPGPALESSIVAIRPATDSTYAERLGYPRGAVVLLIHVDDAGMSLESNEGAIAALTRGAATSVSVMMPCPWVPEFVGWLRNHPAIDAGLHLTLTSEWDAYRWGPVSGGNLVPGLVDSTGNLWPSVPQVVAHARPEEVATEIGEQLRRARRMGFEPTHLDTHMGTVYATPAFLKQYIQLGVANHIPVMLPGGTDKLIQEETKFPDAVIRQMQQLGKSCWDAGLPVLDDLHNFSYDWKVPDSLATTDPTPASDKRLDNWRTAKYIETLATLQPGVTMMIMHCSNSGAHFAHISDSGPLRRGDMLAMLNPAFRKALRDRGIILTTWRELMKRRRSRP
ncbi:MAG TPA: polysaccharide deacetylase family protein [Puia sp.]|nr:polysaccharide deacetylase family protein [Puia sp.]